MRVKVYHTLVPCQLNPEAYNLVLRFCKNVRLMDFQRLCNAKQRSDHLQCEANIYCLLEPDLGQHMYCIKSITKAMLSTLCWQGALSLALRGQQVAEARPESMRS